MFASLGRFAKRHSGRPFVVLLPGQRQVPLEVLSKFDMANHEEEKKNWERAQCQLVAAEINKSKGTDYEAHPPDAEPADVTLKSKSGKYPPLPVQMVSIPLDFRHRDDKHTVEKIREALKRSLEEHGFNHCCLGLVLSGEAEMHGIKHAELELLIEVVLEEAANGNRTLRYEDILERSPRLSELVHDIIISHHEVLQNPDVDIPASSALPPDGRWIKEGILKKVEKYGGPKAVKDLVLVILESRVLLMMNRFRHSKRTTLLTRCHLLKFGL